MPVSNPTSTPWIASSKIKPGREPICIWVGAAWLALRRVSNQEATRAAAANTPSSTGSLR